MRRTSRLGMRWIVLAAALVLPAAARAQANRPRLDVALPAAAALSDDGPTITTANLLADDKTRELLRNGFPARVSYRLELWRGSGLFEDLEAKTEWHVIVSYDPTSKQYRVLRIRDNVQEDFGGFGSVTSVDLQLGQPFRPALHPPRSGKYYYNLLVDVQILTESDLDALQQWLQGPQSKNPIGAVRSGIGALLSRVLGDKIHSEVHTRQFEVP